MHGQLRLPTTHRASRDVVGDLSREVARQLTVDVRVDVTTVAEVLESRHAQETR